MSSRCNLFIVAALILALAACNLQASELGPTTWIDRPLDGDHVPLASLTIQVHASDADGVATIEFFVFDSLLASVPAGGGRLGNASIEWMPPAPGVYTLNVRATDTQGNSNARPMASVQITVSGGSPTPAPAPGLTTITPTPAEAAGGVTITPSAIPGQIITPSISLTQNANCRNGPGTAYDSVDVLVQGQTATIEGRNAESTWFWVLRPSGSGHCWVAGSVGNLTGEWSGVPVAAAPPPPDTTPPVISDVSANPGTISVLVPCGATPATTVIRARVTDPGGIARVVARVSGVGEFEMSPAGGEYYQVTLGPFGEAGTLSIFIQAQDNAGTTAISVPIEVKVVACPG